MLYQPRRRCDHTGRGDTSDDWNGPGWYRFTGSSGTMLATSVGSYELCGTTAPGYLKGGRSSLPTLQGETVNAVVCFFSSTSNSCFQQSNIKIRKCSTFYLYWLPDVPICLMKYCGQ